VDDSSPSASYTTFRIPWFNPCWRSRRWIDLAARECQGWIASGIYTSWEDLEAGIRMYRESGRGRVVLAHLERVACSVTYLDDAAGRDDLEILGDPWALPLGPDGNLPDDAWE